jgi:hypothetical protein
VTRWRRWEGDTLVVDTNNFNDQTWLGWPGYFHSDELRVVEKLTRTGNTITYEVIVEDSKVLQRPWVWTPRMVRLNTDPKAAFLGRSAVQRRGPRAHRDEGTRITGDSPYSPRICPAGPPPLRGARSRR